MYDCQKEEKSRQESIRSLAEEYLRQIDDYHKIEAYQFNPTTDFEETDRDGNDITQLQFVSGESDDPFVCNTEGNRWYFYDETWANLVGPYNTHRKARNAYRKYCEYLNAHDECMREINDRQEVSD